MLSSIGRDVVVTDLVQEVARLSGPDEAICRRAVVAVVDHSSLPLIQAAEQLVSGLRAQEPTSQTVALFWQEVGRLRANRLLLAASSAETFGGQDGATEDDGDEQLSERRSPGEDGSSFRGHDASMV
jgi:hypothetical protein